MNIDNGFGAGVLAHRINLLGEIGEPVAGSTPRAVKLQKRKPGSAKEGAYHNGKI
jgi:hypothetical protein